MRPFRLGLTGSIGMGKSTTAGFFAEAGVPVWDADAAVHRLYARGGALVAPVAALCPAAVADGAVDRAALRGWISGDPAALARLEAVVHPAVAEDRAAFIAAAASDIVVLDIPLLFETGHESEMDATLLVTAPPALQRARVLSRRTMTEAQFEAILARQLPDREKRARATHIIETLGLEAARAGVLALVAFIREHADA
ncbi:dephospho-CoA kinase [Cereibacter sphaeroides]|uniref:dephospho-CoA kinase n=1 Tax=Cereibacter sphaeroides TaxID=1063 RepID=UPI001EEC21AB|nr:dephospho-CoA kinase [Cereibacter sphaeroides]MCE6961015.1 dephospho-CoA kinase [Cereibacter sphaeroides]MCE6969687.1 dephospho-CoA kinase [Cereibacter sphaeroides]MCE6975162.1 dephospho-CoA kinase [Cereibacter sphaeroides]